MRQIKRIFVHCTASSQKWGVKELLAEFKAKGWRNPGYHKVVTEDGVVHQLLDISKVSNGVQGYNSTAINIAYVGGIDSKGKPIDNRTEAQKVALRKLLKELRTQFPQAIIMGHRDIWGAIRKNGKSGVLVSMPCLIIRIYRIKDGSSNTDIRRICLQIVTFTKLNFKILLKMN